MVEAAHTKYLGTDKPNQLALAIFTGTDADMVKGGEGDDLIVAGVGDDIVFGGGGNDMIRTETVESPSSKNKSPPPSEFFPNEVFSLTK